jgi:signal transduction histidine kinase
MLKFSQEHPAIFFCYLVLLVFMFCYSLSRLLQGYQKRQERHDKSIRGMRMSQETSVLKAQLDMQEYTFQTISREVHDNIGQNLSLAKLILNTQTFEDPEHTEKEIKNSAKMIRLAIKDLFDVSNSMNSDIIVHSGLVKAVEAEVIKLNQSHQFLITYKITGYVVFLEGENEIMLYRIVQETLQNIIKHARATLIEIHLYYYPTYFKLAIQDDGKGFEADKVGRGIGMINIQNRAAELKGTCSIISSESGTQLYIELPIKKRFYA